MTEQQTKQNLANNAKEIKSKYFRPLTIGDVKLAGNCVLAPMAGLTEIGFRKIAKQCGACLTTTEMISAKALAYKNEKTLKMLQTFRGEHPVAVQLFGHDPNDFKSAILSGVLDKFDIIDINMGCPAPKIVNNGEGSALMKDLNTAEQIIKTVVAVSKKPVTVKFRSGFDNNHINAIDFAKMCERAGASAITIHGRTRDQYYSGKSDYNVIKQCVEAVKIPVIANGDVFSKEDFDKCLEETGASGVAIARGALGNLEIFANISGKTIKNNKFSQILVLNNELKKAGYGETFILNQLRAHLIYFIKGQKLATQTKQKLLTIPSTQELLLELKKCLQ